MYPFYRKYVSAQEPLEKRLRMTFAPKVLRHFSARFGLTPGRWASLSRPPAVQANR